MTLVTYNILAPPYNIVHTAEPVKEKHHPLLYRPRNAAIIAQLMGVSLETLHHLHLQATHDTNT
jgi:hypothetical protein